MFQFQLGLKPTRNFQLVWTDLTTRLLTISTLVYNSFHCLKPSSENSCLHSLLETLLFVLRCFRSWSSGSFVLTLNLFLFQSKFGSQLICLRLFPTLSRLLSSKDDSLRASFGFTILSFTKQPSNFSSGNVFINISVGLTDV